jgi:hypothetical protein
MSDHERIWLEPAPGADEDYGRQWCQHNVWGDEATEYVLATSVSGFPVELLGVAEELAEGSGAWLACSGCHELNEGHPTGPWSDVLKSHLGLGCRECGGIGAVWDNTDYSAVNSHASLTQELDRLREALEFYADELTWDDTNPKDDGRLTVLVPSPSFAEIDRGERARAALSPDNSTQKKEG